MELSSTANGERVGSFVEGHFSISAGFSTGVSGCDTAGVSWGQITTSSLSDVDADDVAADDMAADDMVADDMAARDVAADDVATDDGFGVVMKFVGLLSETRTDI